MSTVNAGTAETAPTVVRPALGTAAVAALALFVVMFGTWAPESPQAGKADAAAVRAWAAESMTTLRVNAFAGVLAVVALVVLTAALARLARASAPGSPLAGVVLLSGGLLAALNAVVTGVTLLWVLPDLPATGDATLLTWHSLSWFGQMLGEVAVVVQSLLMGAFSVAALRGGIVTRWLCWLGVVLAVTGLVSVVGVVVPSAVFDTAWLAGLYGWMLWPLLAAIVFGLRWARLRR
ncbi:hypothetical protein ACWEQG_16355 [Microbispora sp. NPDC004025]